MKYADLPRIPRGVSPEQHYAKKEKDALELEVMRLKRDRARVAQDANRATRYRTLEAKVAQADPNGTRFADLGVAPEHETEAKSWLIFWRWRTIAPGLWVHLTDPTEIDRRRTAYRLARRQARADRRAAWLATKAASRTWLPLVAPLSAFLTGRAEVWFDEARAAVAKPGDDMAKLSIPVAHALRHLGWARVGAQMVRGERRQKWGALL